MNYFVTHFHHELNKISLVPIEIEIRVSNWWLISFSLFRSLEIKTFVKSHSNWQLQLMIDTRRTSPRFSGKDFAALSRRPPLFDQDYNMILTGRWHTVLKGKKIDRKRSSQWGWLQVLIERTFTVSNTNSMHVSVLQRPLQIVKFFRKMNE